MEDKRGSSIREIGMPGEVQDSEVGDTAIEKGIRVKSQFLTACPVCRNVFEVDEKFNGADQDCLECGCRFTITRYQKRKKEDSKPSRIAMNLPVYNSTNASSDHASDSNSENGHRKSTPARIEIPGLGERSVVLPEKARPKMYVGHGVSERKSPHGIVMEDKLRATLNLSQPKVSESMPKGVVTAAEERVRMYEEISRKKARQKVLRNFVESVMLLMALSVLVGLTLWWMSHKNKVAAEAARVAAEAESERIRLAEERDRVDRELREKNRLEREAALARENEARLRLQAEMERMRQEEKARRELAEREIRDNKERYQMFTAALRENNFRLFGKSVTNDIEKTSGELCYLLPSEIAPAPLYWVVYGQNDGIKVFRLDESGQKEEIDREVLEARTKEQEYLVAKGGNVYFRSLRKTPGTGILGKAENADPADAFFGSMASTVKKLKASYDELTFDVLFTPKNSAKDIFVENVEFGCSYMLENVREAIANNTSVSIVGGQSMKAKKFKRTTMFWNGPDIKQGIGGITYVPYAPPPIRERWTHSNHNLAGYNTIYHSHVVRRDNSRERWQTLYDRAVKEDAEEKSYYESLRARQAERRDSAQAAAEAKLQKKVDEIFRNGTLWYKIRKAKAAK